MSTTSTGGSNRPRARDHAAQLRPGTNCADSVPWTSKFSLRSRITSCSRASSPRTAAVCAASLVHSVSDIGTVGVLNINVPNVRPYAVRGFKAGRLAVGGKVQTAMVEKEPGTLELSFDRFEPEPGTDVAVLREGYVALSLIEVARDVQGDALNTLLGRLVNEELAG